MMEDLEFHYEGEGWVEVTWPGRFLVHHTSGAASDERVAAMCQRLVKWSLRQETVRFALVVAGNPPSKAGRAMFDDALVKVGDRVDSMVVWVQVSGLKGAVLRSVATGMLMLGSRRHRPTFIASREELREFLAGDADSPIDAVLEKLFGDAGGDHVAK